MKAYKQMQQIMNFKEKVEITHQNLKMQKVKGFMIKKVAIQVFQKKAAIKWR